MKIADDLGEKGQLFTFWPRDAHIPSGRIQRRVEIWSFEVAQVMFTRWFPKIRATLKTAVERGEDL